MIKKIAAAAILMCAVMVLVAGAPLVTADTHHIVKGAQGPRASAVSWMYTPTDSGIWTGHIVNSGLRSLVVDVTDASGSSILHQRIRFAAYPSDTLDTNGAIMAKGQPYEVTATPNGPKTTSCTVDDAFQVYLPLVASFTWTVNGATVTVDGSTSYDPNGGTITGWGWDFGDGAIATGVTASHTYSAYGIWTIMLTVMSSNGMTGSTSHDVYVGAPDQPPVASFTAISTSWTVSVDASASTDDHGIVSYAWNWGDGSALGSGVTATHQYSASSTYNIKLTVTDTVGQTGTLTKAVVVLDNPPVAAFTYTTHSWTLSVDASASTDDYGIVNYYWSWGDGSPQSSGVTATHTYTASNTYSVRLNVTDTVGQLTMLTKQIPVVDNPPVASFIVSATGLTVSVDASASTDDYGIVSYDWNWGDGSANGMGATASHTYATPASMPVVSGRSTILAGPPPLPFYVFGYLTDSSGNPLANCVVTITDQRTGDTATGILSDASGFYSTDISVLPNGYSAGDTILVSATSPTGATASGSGVVGSTPYMEVDLTLTGGVQPVIVTITLTVTDMVGQTSVLTQTVTLTP